MSFFRKSTMQLLPRRNGAMRRRCVKRNYIKISSNKIEYEGTCCRRKKRLIDSIICTRILLSVKDAQHEKSWLIDEKN